MSDSELRTEDSLQSVKYLGKIHSPYAHGIGVAVVSIISSLLFFYSPFFSNERNLYKSYGNIRKKVQSIIVVLYQYIHQVYVYMKK